jgi:hypothetical protein
MLTTARDSNHVDLNHLSGIRSASRISLPHSACFLVMLRHVKPSELQADLAEMATCLLVPEGIGNLGKSKVDQWPAFAVGRCLEPQHSTLDRHPDPIATTMPLALPNKSTIYG